MLLIYILNLITEVTQYGQSVCPYSLTVALQSLQTCGHLSNRMHSFQQKTFKSANMLFFSSLIVCQSVMPSDSNGYKLKIKHQKHKVPFPSLQFSC